MIINKFTILGVFILSIFTIFFLTILSKIHDNLNHNFKRIFLNTHCLVSKTKKTNYDIQYIGALNNDLLIYDFRANTVYSLDTNLEINKKFGNNGMIANRFKLLVSCNSNNCEIILSDPYLKRVYIYNMYGKNLLKVISLRFTRLAGIDSNILIFTKIDTLLRDIKFMVYNINTNEIKEVQPILDLHRDYGIANDGFFITNMNKETAYISYYTSNVYIFKIKDKYLHLIKGSTIDSNFKYPVAIQYAYNTFVPPGNVKEINYTGYMSNKYIYILSKIKSSNDKLNLISKKDVIDIYDINNFTYKYSFIIKHYKGNSVKNFYVDDDTKNLYAVQGSYIIKYKILQ